MIILKEGISCIINLLGCMLFLTCLCLASTGSFDLHVHTSQGCEVPEKWDETQPCIIKNAQELSLRTFSTSLHKVETHVIYKAE
jgi:mitotic spindle assembly checkpoint protein MAD2